MREHQVAGPMPLEGITVVSLEQAVAAPLASCRLADAGARVIKVERPGGDFARGYDVAANGASSYFTWLNRGKESVMLDLTDDADRRVMFELIAASDVFLQNLSAGASARLGFGAESLRRRHPELIVCDITGYGEVGPLADAKAYDLLVQAESGLLSVSGSPGPPGRIGVSVVDIGTGLNAASAILAALYRRLRTGLGAHLRVSLFDSIAEWMTVPLLHYDYLGSAPERLGLAHPSIAPYGGFELADGSVILISIQSDREWRALCDGVLLRPELGTDPDYATNVARVRNRERTDAVVASSLRDRPIDEVLPALARARIAFSRLNDVAALSAHPHLRRVAVTHAHGMAEIPAPPVRTDWERVGAVPDIDQHGAEIRAVVESADHGG